jgi:hypothetical protein
MRRRVTGAAASLDIDVIGSFELTDNAVAVGFTMGATDPAVVVVSLDGALSIHDVLEIGRLQHCPHVTSLVEPRGDGCLGDELLDADISENTGLIVGGYADGRVAAARIERDALAPCWTVDSSSGEAEHVSIAPDGAHVVIAHRRGLVVRRCDDGASGHESPLDSGADDIDWRSDGAAFAVARYGGHDVHEFDASRERIRTTSLNYGGMPRHIAWSPDGRSIAIAQHEPAVRFLAADARTADQMLMMAGFPRRVTQLCWTPDSTKLGTASAAALAVWSCDGPGPGGRAPVLHERHEAFITAAAISQHGPPRLATGDQDGALVIGSAAAEGESAPAVRVRLPGAVRHIVWGLDARMVCASTDQATAHVFRVT